MARIKTRGLLVIISIVSTYFMLTINYDPDFRLTFLMPVTYGFIVAFLCKNDNLLQGLGGSALVFFYCFRMCLLPVICAIGDFYMEPYKSDYIAYYNNGILLNCIECLIVFLSLRYFTRIFNNRRHLVVTQSLSYNNHHILTRFVFFLTVVVVLLQFGLGVHYYSPITNQAEDIVDEVLGDASHGAYWYITDILSTWWRPLITILLIYFVQTKRIPHPQFWIVLIAALNIFFMSDRRIYALLVGGYALYYAMSISRSKITKRLIAFMLLGGGGVTLFFGFYGAASTADLEIVSRTFQHYFSGPTLNALALRTLDAVGVKPLEFMYLLLNDFQSFTALFGRIEMPNYYDSFFGMSFGLWVPMTVGALRYFGFFFPLVLIFFVYYIKKCDYDASISSYSLYSMIYYYIGVCIACYMVMYTVELIFYFILTTGILYRALIYFDKRNCCHFYNRKNI